MKVFIAREDATGHSLEDIILGVYNTKEKALESCNDQVGCWKDNWEYDTDSGWLLYSELTEGGWTREFTLKGDEACLIYKVYEAEVQ